MNKTIKEKLNEDRKDLVIILDIKDEVEFEMNTLGAKRCCTKTLKNYLKNICRDIRKGRLNPSNHYKKCQIDDGCKKCVQYEAHLSLEKYKESGETMIKENNKNSEINKQKENLPIKVLQTKHLISDKQDNKLFLDFENGQNKKQISFMGTIALNEIDVLINALTQLKNDYSII